MSTNELLMKILVSDWMPYNFVIFDRAMTFYPCCTSVDGPGEYPISKLLRKLDSIYVLETLSSLMLEGKQAALKWYRNAECFLTAIAVSVSFSFNTWALIARLYGDQQSKGKAHHTYDLLWNSFLERGAVHSEIDVDLMELSVTACRKVRKC